jgi:hypothetical protein
MALEFRTTAGFQEDLRSIPEPDRARVRESIDRRGRLAVADRRAFYRGLERPGVRKLAGRLDSSLYVLRVGKDLRVLLALDDDPIFGRTILTVLRVVRRQDLEDAYRKTAFALYGERLLHGQKEGGEEATSRGREGGRAKDETLARRVRSHPRSTEDSADE